MAKRYLFPLSMGIPRHPTRLLSPGITPKRLWHVSEAAHEASVASFLRGGVVVRTGCEDLSSDSNKG